MNNTTKQKLGRALYTLLQEKQLNEINVADITALCGLSRKTFYYYYQDVYSLVYGFIEDTFDRIASEEGYRFWPIFERLVRLVKENSEVVQNVYNSFTALLADIPSRSYAARSATVPIPKRILPLLATCASQRY